jgi:integral membrane sensor domain MASE1
VLLAIPPGYATAVWPSAGIALAWLLIFGYHCWPGVLLGSFLINSGVALGSAAGEAVLRSLAVAGLISCGAAWQALAGAYLVRRWVHLSQLLARLLGGQIVFQSEYGKGSVFTLVIPQG